MSLFDKIKQVLKDGGKEHPAQEPLPTPPVKPKNHSREHRTIATTEEPPPLPKAKGSDQGSDEMTLQTLATVDPQEQKSISLRKPKSRTRIGKESHVRAFSKKSKKLNSETTKDSSGVIKDKFTNSIKLPAPAAPSSKTAMKLRGPESLKASRKKKASKVVTEATTETLATVEKPLPRSTKSPGLRKSKMKHKDKKKSSSDYVVDKCSSEKAKRSKLKHQGTKDAEGMSGGKRREKSIYMPPEDAPEGQNSIMKKVEPDSEQNTKFEVLNVAPRPAVSVFIRKKKTLIVRRGAPVDVQDLPPKWKNSMEPLGGRTTLSTSL
ncbi:hypothetical protein L596_013023 [Steinernema carpocapsae]|uniref:Uncharacterized protein n=1 Tax=Steinernema carpocapsae TaxID=34508 RepID=A0A4U5NZ59_STECR|nr:hypothetical protein L596_013023 [Steinernema carpocapsae]